MAKLVLGSAPKTFKSKITFELLDGGKADIEMIYKYKTRNEYAKLIDSTVDEQEATGKKEQELKSSEIYKMVDEKVCEFILEIAEGWDLTDEFNAESVAKLVNEFPMASGPIIEKYRSAILDGRTKN